MKHLKRDKDGNYYAIHEIVGDKVYYLCPFCETLVGTYCPGYEDRVMECKKCGVYIVESDIRKNNGLKYRY